MEREPKLANKEVANNKKVAADAEAACCEAARRRRVLSGVLVGDFMHNLVDGVFIGTAFSACRPREAGPPSCQARGLLAPCSRPRTPTGGLARRRCHQGIAGVRLRT
eukprot:4088794-Pyramimonas_sp.AAC.2